MRGVADGVIRVWKGFGTPDGVRRYCEEHFVQVVLPELRALDGFVGATVLVRSRESDTELVVATRWDSIDAITQFAGEDYHRAVVEPVVRELLDTYEERVHHYSIALSTHEPAAEA
jgi:heme-degrading monooxygenase HmoA